MPPAAGLSTAPPAAEPGYFRVVAQWGVQAAEALDHAHQLGVVHRDIKPSNLMVDAGGRLWVTDFGVAQFHSDARLTLTGDLVGTLRYMSPEQALAQRAVLDHRTDIYSLGATLYELLALVPAFAGTDRQELLRQIAFEEPRPPRRVNKAVPAELEVIVLKAMAKAPEERYATAQELADDLRRFLEDRPIQAKRPSLALRARKWARRHQAVVWSAAVVAVLAVLLGGSSWSWIVVDRARRQAAQESKDGEQGARAEAELTVVANLRKQAKTAPPAVGRSLLAEALAAARRADGLLAHRDPDDPQRKEVAALVEELQAEERDRRMLAQLEEAALAGEPVPDFDR